MIDLGNATFDYEPYPAGVVKPVFEPGLYERLVASYPDKSLFEFKPALGNKYSLSEVNHAAQYDQFIRGNADWQRFHAYVKGDDFVPQVLAFLKARHIDLGLDRYKVVSRAPIERRASALSRLRRRTELSARFEFSMMGADGGSILPHTDTPQKLVTLVFSMAREGEWNPAWGGGTDIVLPKDRTRIYNHLNRYLGFEDVDVLKTLEFTPNQCVIFVKTYNSWHSVSPMTGTGTDALRRTLTVNIEAKG
jgi:hypothetical protein